jgi:hypothetical protein
MSKLIAVIIVIVLCVVTGFALNYCDKPPVTPTPTYTPTYTLEPTLTFTPTKTQTVVVTETVEPVTPTVTATLKPTYTPTPKQLVVHTGYEGGWLHYRPGPSKSYIPLWVTGIGAVQEETILGFVDCPDVDYAWVHVIYKGYDGYVYGDFLNYNPCVK